MVLSHDGGAEDVGNGDVEVGLADVGVDVGGLTSNRESVHDATEAAHGLHRAGVNRHATARAEVVKNGFVGTLILASLDGR